ncbi:MAG: ABC transporter ATP-binding protein [Flavobacteriales bacterium]|nr:ABC transporter ATP-binding protein [Flavobacteriales bacterium]
MIKPLLSVHDLHFAHVRGQEVLAGTSVEVQEAEVLVVVGPSGCGKSTLLRCIAGLEKPSRGSVTMAGNALTDARSFIPPEARGIGFVFQGLALFPHLTVKGNIAFGLNGLPASERTQRVRDELRSVGLVDLADRYPHELSGGQQQRVAIARSLVRRPKLMLMDEPFSDLDPKTRSEVRTEVMRILRANKTAAVIVTHDREDAFHVADRIAEMDHGRIVRVAPASEFRSEWTQHPFQEV